MGKIVYTLFTLAMIIYGTGCTSKKEQTSNNMNLVVEHEYVDLGLPSGTKWAISNVGAAKPTEYGDYFAWGETTPFFISCGETVEVPAIFLLSIKAKGASFQLSYVKFIKTNARIFIESIKHTSNIG